jgi:hypothetical protein
LALRWRAALHSSAPFLSRERAMEELRHLRKRLDDVPDEKDHRWMYALLAALVVAAVAYAHRPEQPHDDPLFQPLSR